ncbi:hypothetical protein M231_01477 [Tremella mesenterica]|uniref:Uncharacterized protein n=1 Tax=Tremella mesenterica TaxID=5217 RepID=A0A4V1M4R9_TREME|nr:hypothetical protein M231_01477 [Tremella mesenterica]
MTVKQVGDKYHVGCMFVKSGEATETLKEFKRHLESNLHNTCALESQTLEAACKEALRAGSEAQTAVNKRGCGVYVSVFSEIPADPTETSSSCVEETVITQPDQSPFTMYQTLTDANGIPVTGTVHNVIDALHNAWAADNRRLGLGAQPPTHT